jgi:hypothetical protein
MREDDGDREIEGGHVGPAPRIAPRDPRGQRAPGLVMARGAGSRGHGPVSPTRRVTLASCGESPSTLARPHGPGGHALCSPTVWPSAYLRERREALER